MTTAVSCDLLTVWSVSRSFAPVLTYTFSLPGTSLSSLSSMTTNLSVDDDLGFFSSDIPELSWSPKSKSSKSLSSSLTTMAFLFCLCCFCSFLVSVSLCEVDGMTCVVNFEFSWLITTSLGALVPDADAESTEVEVAGFAVLDTAMSISIL